MELAATNLKFVIEVQIGPIIGGTNVVHETRESQENVHGVRFLIGSSGGRKRSLVFAGGFRGPLDKGIQDSRLLERLEDQKSLGKVGTLGGIIVHNASVNQHSSKVGHVGVVVFEKENGPKFQTFKPSKVKEAIAVPFGRTVMRGCQGKKWEKNANTYVSMVAPARSNSLSREMKRDTNHNKQTYLA